MKIIIEPYSDDWKLAFEKESELLLNSINDKDIVIEHIGSTSVIGLGAKPIIDIMIGLKDFSTANTHIPTIVNLGYKYVSKFECIMPYRRFFTKELNGEKTHHIHMVQLGTEFWNRHLLFRDHLRNDINDRNKYLELKINLADKEWKNGSEYADAKTDFIRQIEIKAANKI
jgi:GrpB-like predicted nucleotidyltransferase (UPF0157 family)